MVEDTKIEAVREYLENEFPGFQVDNVYDDERLSQMFRVGNGTKLYIVKFEQSFYEDSPEIKKVLEYLELSKFMRHTDGKQVLVTRKGLIIL